MPYSITFVGVNGVGKSTNLSKVCFWLIQNGLRVLIAACDTFRYVHSPFCAFAMLLIGDKLRLAMSVDMAYVFLGVVLLSS